MLGKLLKYEVRATARNFLPLFAALLVFSVFNRILYSQAVSDVLWQTGWLRGTLYGIMGFAYAVVICAVVVVAFVVIIQRFYKNLMGDEGYLMMTLPVRPWEHVISKMLIAAMWTVASVLITILSVVIMTAEWIDVVDFFTHSLREAFAELAFELGMPAPVAVAYVILICIVGLFSGILCIYASIALGQTWKRHKVAGALVSYAAVSIATQIIAVVVFRVLGGLIWNFVWGATETWMAMVVFLLMLLAFGAAYYFIANHILSKRLNLQ